MKNKGKMIIGIITTVLLLAAVGGYFYYRQANNKQNEIIRAKQVIDEKREIALGKAEKLKRGYYVDEAISLLKEDSELDDEKVNSKIKEYEEYKESFVKYTGPVEHVFFHSLIVYPELAFDNKGHSAEGYNMWFTTVKEFKTMLPLLQEKGYVLMNITDIFKKDSNGKMKRQDIYLPEGKKPLVMSQDDVNYYDYMKPDGFADRLVIDENNEVSTVVKDLKGKEAVTRDGDMVPILDDYIKENPEFSYKGAKGILAVTGYEGVLGYRCETEEDKQKAKEVATKLRETGWIISSHSYTHNGNGYFGENPQYKNLEYDFKKWNDEVKPIVGDTRVFISPYGVMLEGENYKLAEEYGFDIYCNVERRNYGKIEETTAIMPRFNLDGFTFYKDKEVVKERYFDPDKVIDPDRPILK